MKRNAQLRSDVSKQHIVGEARLNFQVLADGPPPASFGPRPALLSAAPPIVPPRN
jgi:hypothetical protein